MPDFDPTNVHFRRNLILASAFYHAPPPADLMHANCARVLQNALIAGGLCDEKLNEAASGAFHGDEEVLSLVLVAKQWYSTLIELTHDLPVSEQLLNGAENLATPAGAYFTACRLTPTGRLAAEKLLADHPDWKTKLNTGLPK